MAERTQVAVEARFAPDGAVTPLAVIQHGCRQNIAAVGRQWMECATQCFDVQLDSGETMILFLRERPLRWYASRVRGHAKMV